MNKKPTLKTINKNKKVIKRIKVVKLTPKQAKITQDLGNGFTRLVFTGTGPEFTVGARSTKVITFDGTDRNVYPISGGWFIEQDTQFPAFAVSSYPQNERTWVIALREDAGFRRRFQVFFIVKNPEQQEEALKRRRRR